MYSVDGQNFEAGEIGFQSVLERAYKNHVRPMCLCSLAPIPIYITSLGGTFVLKRMPCTGSRHAGGCPHYEPPEELPWSAEIRTAISEDPDTGVTQLRVGFAMSKGAKCMVVPSSGQDRGGVGGGRARLNLRGLLHFLWMEAELTKWRPGFDGKRSWAVVRSHLLAAASNKVLKGMALTDALFVPEAFTIANAQAIRARRAQRFAQGLRRNGRAESKMILIGELKEVFATRFHFNVMIKHVPEVPFLLNANLHRKMMRHFENELALWSGSAETHLIIAATFALADWGRVSIDELCLMPTSAQWLPIDDCFEKQLIDQLVCERRSFDKALGFNSKLPSRSISAVLLDVQREPVPLALDRTCGGEPDSAHDPMVGTWRWQTYMSDLPVFPS